MDDLLKCPICGDARFDEGPRCHYCDEAHAAGFQKGVAAAAKVVADAHREINDREGTDRATVMIVKSWLADAEIEIRALAQPAATGDGAP